MGADLARGPIGYDAKFYVAKLYSLESMPEVPVITQERAYSSPIWYTP